MPENCETRQPGICETAYPSGTPHICDMMNLNAKEEAHHFFVEVLEDQTDVQGWKVVQVLVQALSDVAGFLAER